MATSVTAVSAALGQLLAGRRRRRRSGCIMAGAGQTRCGSCIVCLAGWLSRERPISAQHLLLIN